MLRPNAAPGKDVAKPNGLVAPTISYVILRRNSSVVEEPALSEAEGDPCTACASCAASGNSPRAVPIVELDTTPGLTGLTVPRRSIAR
jgi:hypothetical protein